MNDEHLGERDVALPVLPEHVLVQDVPHELELGRLLKEVPAHHVART